MASAVAEVWYTILVEVNFTLVTPYYYELSLPARCAVDEKIIMFNLDITTNPSPPLIPEKKSRMQRYRKYSPLKAEICSIFLIVHPATLNNHKDNSDHTYCQL